jgi:hypothetical protein
VSRSVSSDSGEALIISRRLPDQVQDPQALDATEQLIEPVEKFCG